MAPVGTLAAGPHCIFLSISTRVETLQKQGEGLWHPSALPRLGWGQEGLVALEYTLLSICAGALPASSKPWEALGRGWGLVQLLHLLKAPLAHGPGCRGLVVGEHLDASLAVHEPVMTVGGGAQCPGHLGPHCSALVIISLLGTCDETIGAYSSVMDSAEAPWELAWCCEGAGRGRVLALL